MNQKENYLYYLYNTEVTLGLQKHFQNYAKSIIQKYKIENNSFCVDIGSNDGSMLKSLKKNKMRVLGIEPCYDIAKKANANGLKFLPPNKKDLTNKELGELIINGTVYLECFMTIAKIKKMLKDQNNRKAFFNTYK